MSGSKFSTSRGTVIYVQRLPQASSVRTRCGTSSRWPGPENQDTDFTWEEFVRRTNFELANEWGNLVNRSISMAHKNVGAIPKATALTDADDELLKALSRGGVRDGRRAPAPLAVQAGVRPRPCAWSRAANKYLSDQEPWKLKDDPDRRDTVLHTALQVVQDANTLLTPFLPHSAQKVHEALGGTGVWAAQPEMTEVERPGRAGPLVPDADR